MKIRKITLGTKGFLLTIFFTLALSHSICAQNWIRLTPVKDTYVHQFYMLIDVNFGSNQDFNTWTRESEGWVARAYMMFDLSGIPARQQITGATLYLRQGYGGEPGNLGVEVHHVANDTWEEDTITWLNRPDDGAYGDEIGFNSTGTTYIGWLSWDLFTSGNVAWDPSGDRADGFLSLLLKEEEQGDQGRIFTSKESIYPSNWPYLEITTEPIPTIDGQSDFDGDGTTDVSGFHLPTDQLFTDYAGNLGQYGWGGSDSMPLVWVYGDDVGTDVSFYHIPTNRWFVQGVGDLGQFGWGGDDSVPVPGDYDGDGLMDRAVYHSPSNRWFVEGYEPVAFGWNGAECIPLPADYDGDGVTDMMLYHIPTNQWSLYGVGNLGQFGWGGSDCIPVPADFDGDGVADIAVYHVPTNQWFVKGIGALGQFGWGGMDSFPIPGDYNGDGAVERGFYRHGANWWFIEGESDFIWGWGGADFMPITSSTCVYNWLRFMLHRFE